MKERLQDTRFLFIPITGSVDCSLGPEQVSP